MLEIDGALGEGGGQIIRSSLALSVLTGTPFVMNNVRKKRRNPGLQRQHLTCLRAAKKISGAKVRGGEIRSESFEFRPKSLKAGNYEFQIGTAGSTSLVLQTILPALIRADAESEITLAGGTHNPMAPPIDFLQRAYLPLIHQLGLQAHVQLVRHGFYPKGGGEIKATISPSPCWNKLELLSRGNVVRTRAIIINSGIPDHVARREADALTDRLAWEESDIEIRTASDALSPGNFVMLSVEYEHVSELFCGFGEKGKPAERVVSDTVQQLERYQQSDAVLGEFLADQFMLPLGISAHFGLGGGSFRTLALSEHSKTHLEILHKFLDVKIRVETRGEDLTEVQIRSA